MMDAGQVLLTRLRAMEERINDDTELTHMMEQFLVELQSLHDDGAELLKALLMWQCDESSERTRKQTMKLLTLRWRCVTKLLETNSTNVGSMILSRMMKDRFTSLDVQREMAECLITMTTRWEINEDMITLIKQFYVTLSDPSIRKRLSHFVLCTLIATKSQVKELIQVGMLRAVIQVAIDTARSSAAIAALEGGSEEEEETLVLLQNANQLLLHISKIVCPKQQGTISDLSTFSTIPSSVYTLCTIIALFGISRVTVVCEESIRLLQMIVEFEVWVPILIQVPSLRGVLEKFKILSSSVVSIRPLCEQLYSRLIPEIDAYERVHGSLVNMPANDHKFSTIEDALEVAIGCKAQGNTYFQCGNFGTARLFYRRSIVIVRSAQAMESQRLSKLPHNAWIQQCSIGATVLVVQEEGKTCRSAMISGEIEDNMVDVVYDNDENEKHQEEEESVALNRIRLQVPTRLLNQCKTVVVDCAMNMGKACAHLGDFASAIECFTHALDVQPEYIVALYHRGIAFMAQHELHPAKRDLWAASQRCRTWKPQTKEEKQKKNTLHSQIVTAYKRLQVLHSNKKKTDKKLIKQMINYLATIPGLQEGEDTNS